MSSTKLPHAGVIEGFYGRPWTSDERRRLIGWLAESGLNTYLYAPKDDLKHRALWREPYTEAEHETLASLAGACRARDITFVYAIAPGLDLRYRDELPLIQAKLARLLDAGVTTFALLFDDIPKQLDPADAAVFPSFARAQVHVANALLAWLHAVNPRATLWFCPTIYCARFAELDVPGNAYLREVGAHLAPAIEVLWTGPEIIPETIPVDSIQEVSAVLRRAPIIWDNLHANDYDLRRLFLGPFAGRPLALREAVRGVLLNPNCEFEANYIPLHTLGDYVQAGTEWDPAAARAAAVARWLPAFTSRTGREVTRADLDLLVDLFHLPFQAGPRAEELIAQFAYLVRTPAALWDNRRERFERTADAIAELFVKLTELENRELSFTFYRLMWEIQAELKLMRGYLKVRATNPAPDATYTPPFHHDPRIYRGGVVARLQRLMPMTEPGRFHAAAVVAGG